MDLLAAASAGETPEIANAIYGAVIGTGGLAARVVARRRAKLDEADEEDLVAFRKIAMEALARQAQQPAGDMTEARLKRLEKRLTGSSRGWEWGNRAATVVTLGAFAWGGEQLLHGILKALGAE